MQLLSCFVGRYNFCFFKTLCRSEIIFCETCIWQYITLPMPIHSADGDQRGLACRQLTNNSAEIMASTVLRELGFFIFLQTVNRSPGNVFPQNDEQLFLINSSAQGERGK